MRKYTRNTLPPKGSPWAYYEKKVKTRAIRIAGAFAVETKEGELVCSDGWLAVDSLGWPYPIADDEFKRIYVTAESEVKK